MQVVECSVEYSTRKSKKGKEKQVKDVQNTKKKPKPIDMASIAEGGDNIEVESSETKTLGVSEYIVHGGKPFEGEIQSFIEMQEHEICDIIEGMYDVFRIKFFFTCSNTYIIVLLCCSGMSRRPSNNLNFIATYPA